MEGQTVSHYRILDKIGEGGMGQVYLAEDTSLDRKVALKFLSVSLHADSVAQKRFLREAKSAAAIDHPFICKIFEVSQTDDAQDFIVMEYVEGQTLKDRLERGPIRIEQTLQLALEVAEALEEAQKRGFIHRDLKPSNIMLTSSGHAKIMDFGLAKKISKGETTEQDITLALTREGMTLGTLAYMSPEQLRGETVDTRSDIFSFGVVLYEMLTGVHPFRKATAVETTQSILAEEPPLLARYTQEAPELLQYTFQKMLAKDQDQRYQSIHEVRTNLRKQLKEAPVTPSAEQLSIVVLPFDNLSPDPDQDYFVDGLTEEVISDLAKVRALRVISRTSAMSLKGTRRNLRAISRELNVRYVLEGSVRRAGNALRITAQLIDAPTDTHMWAEKYSGTLDDVFDIQEKVSRSIVYALELKLTPQEDIRIAEQPTQDIQVYELILRARRDIESFTESGIHRAIRDLATGLEVVGENTELYYLLGEAYLYCREFGLKVEGGVVQKAEECTRQIMRVDPDSARAYHLMGRIERFRGSALEGLRYFERAFAREPDHPDTLVFLVVGYCWQAGQPLAALEVAKKLVRIDPLAPPSYLMLAYAQWMNGDLDQVIQSFERALEMEPDNIISRFFLPFILLWKKEFRQAFERIDQITRQKQADNIPTWTSEMLLFLKYAFERKPEQATASLSDSTEDFLWNDPDIPWLVAGVFSVMNNMDEAFRWLKRAIDRGFINYPLFAEQDPFYENIREDVRFKKLMERIKPEWERFKVGIDLSTLPPAEMIRR